MSDDKLILVDADGVLLNWEYAFHVWYQHHGNVLVKEDYKLYERINDQYGLDSREEERAVGVFNTSAAIGFLPPLRDSVEYVEQLASKGFRFHVITSVSDDENVARLRRMNLTKLYGNVFDHVECLPIGSKKKDYLSKFKDSGLFWVEDNIHNAEDGLAVGLQPLLMEHGHNMDYKNSEIPRVKNWKEIYEIVSSRCTFIKQIG